MQRKLIGLVACLVLAACGGAGPTGPDTDPAGRATMTVEIWQGGSPGCGGPACDGPVSLLRPGPDGSYTIQSDRKHKLILKIMQPGISGRRIETEGTATAEIFAGEVRFSSGFNENPPANETQTGAEFEFWRASGRHSILVRLTETGPGVQNQLTADLVLNLVPRQ